MLGFLKKAASMFERADLPELPPPEFRDLPPGPSYRIEYFDSQPSLETWARDNHIEANDAYNRRKFMGGVAVQAKVIGLLRPGLMRDQTWDNRVYQHEVGGHSNGLEHAHGGHEWGVYGPDGKFYPVRTRAELQILTAKLYPQAPAHYDWSQAFTQPRLMSTTETASTRQAGPMTSPPAR